MKNYLIAMSRSLLVRQQAAQSLGVLIKSGIGGLVAIATIAWLGHITDSIWLMAPFGATCVLLFSLPSSPLSQPANVIGGHLVSTAIGLLLYSFLPLEWWSLGLSVGLAIFAMALLRVTHPPAGADPLVVFFTEPGWAYLGMPVALGSILLVIIAILIHAMPPRFIRYPVIDKSVGKTAAEDKQ